MKMTEKIIINYLKNEGIEVVRKQLKISDLSRHLTELTLENIRDDIYASKVEGGLVRKLSKYPAANWVGEEDNLERMSPNAICNKFRKDLMRYYISSILLKSSTGAIIPVEKVILAIGTNVSTEKEIKNQLVLAYNQIG